MKLAGRTLNFGLVVFVFLLIMPAGQDAAFSADKEYTEVELETRIVEATIYRRGEVRVIRSGSAEAEPGLYSFICGGLPYRIDNSSVQVEGSGSAAAEIAGINIRQRDQDPSVSPEYNRLKMEMERLKSRIDSLLVTQSALHQRLKFVSSLSDFKAKSAREEMAGESFTVGEWRGILDFIEGENTGIKNRMSTLEKEIASAEERKKVIERKMRQMRVSEAGKEVQIECSVKSSGRLSFRVSYLVGEASWTPEYVIRYNRRNTSIGLDYRGFVVQRTGEDWEDVSIFLSTARPYLGAGPPVLIPAYLKKRIRIPRASSKSREGYDNIEEALALKSGIVKTGDELHVKGGGVAEPQEVSHAEAGADVSGFSANFEVRSPVTLASGDSRRVLVRSAELPVELSLYTAPRISPHVFATGELTNTMEVPILKGKAGVYVVSAPSEGSSPVSTFVGENLINEVAPGGEAEIPLGIDQDVRVEHELTNREYLSREG
ncbi:MAG: mucoidy inhibitor MuiA family protein, partial [Candidatus Krumholzibacteriales bacterium]